MLSLLCLSCGALNSYHHFLTSSFPVQPAYGTPLTLAPLHYYLHLTDVYTGYPLNPAPAPPLSSPQPHEPHQLSEGVILHLQHHMS